jgi:hypothetical protein
MQADNDDKGFKYAPLLTALPDSKYFWANYNSAVADEYDTTKYLVGKYKHSLPSTYADNNNNKILSIKQT